MSVACREARVADAAEMGRIRDAGGWSGGATAAVMGRYLAGEHHPQHALAPRVGFVAEKRGELLGFIAGHLTRRFGCDGELQWVYVTPEYQGREIATMLLRQLAAWFVQQGARRICVNVEPANTRARAFYIRNGARELSSYWLEWPDIETVLAA